MKVVYHKKYKEVYAADPAARAGRIQSIYVELYGSFEFFEPEPASEADLRLAHTQTHIDSIKRRGLYDNALLAVGGAIKASQLAMKGEPAFGLIRPPGHHASPNGCWGFCFFNNIAISVEKLRKEGEIKKALIVDFDLHYGDGTANIFSGIPEVSYYHLPGGSRKQQLNKLSDYLSGEKDYDVIASSAGFDRHAEDWGGMLETEDYQEIGKLIKEFAERQCDGKRYAVLEGGYNHLVLGKNVKAFLDGMR
ncbi:histone deacetylase family protein [Candidatus Bathyarchaeota archaeon]|nr:histone deacetylase family protein [Candidatus Bathyarchaeota archaeon]